MNDLKETTIQLERLKDHCKAMSEIDDCCSNYTEYVKALDKAIGILKDLDTDDETECEEKDRIYSLLNEIGVPQNLKGYEYTADALLHMTAFPNMKIKDIYSSIAIEHDTTAQIIERSIRYCVERTFDSIKPESIESFFSELDCNRSEPTNNEFLTSIADYLSFCEFF
ncbi:MAG: sporulation initiation factor Spo0A C-terminal domain-containing protein [Clostridium sp.]|nr:sporulation initiation factor Spo0A C-terminal domain-containing protein [Clostridium sp.]MCM1547932.1 sporulation initiation factor Spo0A C-terminal domain-containing protein [Ruminococcus sp.]